MNYLLKHIELVAVLMVFVASGLFYFGQVRYALVFLWPVVVIAGFLSNKVKI